MIAGIVASQRFFTSAVTGKVRALFHFNGATDLDDSPIAWTSTSASLDSSQSKFGGSSCLFDGSASRITVSNNPVAGENQALFNPSQDFSIECFVRLSTAKANTIFANANTAVSSGCVFEITATGLLQLRIANAAGVVQNVTGATAISTGGSFKHVAVTKEGLTVRLFIDGVKDAETVLASAGASATAQGSIGRHAAVTTSVFSGWIDELRIVVGQAVYAANFTPPSSPFKHSYVASLMHYDGASGGAATVDSSFSTWTANGNAQLSTAFSRFGGASMILDGTGDFLQAPVVTKNNVFQPSQDFTIECWVALSSLKENCIFSNYSSGSNGCVLKVTAAGLVELQVGNGTSRTAVTSSSALSVSTSFTHIAASKDGSTIRVFINGLKVGEATVAGTPPSTGGTAARIGRESTITANDFSGYIDELRITVGSAVYKADFTVPTTAFPNPSP